jgi:hypothetical protein
MKLSQHHLQTYAAYRSSDPEAIADQAKRVKRQAFFAEWTERRIREASREDLVALFTPLWSMAIWGNKAVYVDQCIETNGLDPLRQSLADLIHGKAELAARWDAFRGRIKRVGVAMASEFLSHFHPENCLPWTTVTKEVFLELDWPNTPTQSYQIDGKLFTKICQEAREIAKKLREVGVKEADAMEVNYFLWWLSGQIKKPVGKASKATLAKEPKPEEPKAAEFLHDEVKEKLANIGTWLGFTTRNEVNVAAGARVDTVWEATIGNMGRVIYVFEVQTKGSIDSLLVNLLKSLNNPAVQGVVAVSDKVQIEKIKRHVQGMTGLQDKLKTWNYEEVLEVAESLAMVNQRINALGLVPEGF